MRITAWEVWIKRFWPWMVAGAVAIFSLSGLLFYVALSSEGQGSGTAVASSTPPIASASSSEEFVPRLLDGMSVTADGAALPAYAVMIENSPEARPLSGLAEADLVLEMPVEGGITRFMAVYDASTTVEQIGPVRSARPYYVDLASALGAAYAHVGGSPDALQRIASLSKFENLDEFANGKYFWRSAKRAAPHNVYTRSDLLHAAAEQKQWNTTSTFQSWKYSTSTVSGGSNTEDVRIPYGGAFNVTWSYDPATQSYIRKQANVRQTDADGAAVTSSNVVVLLTEGQVLDEIGRLSIRTTGRGKAWLFRDGRRFDLTWHRAAGSWLSFETSQGQDAVFKPGPTWISVVTSPNMAPKETESDVKPATTSPTSP